MNTVIFQTENALFKFALKEVKEILICKKTEYVPDEVLKLLDLISTDSDEIFLHPDDHRYFGLVVLDLISAGVGKVTCKICSKTYDASQLKEFAVGHGKSPFDINQEQKGGNRLFEKGKNPSMFGGKGYRCPAGHELIAMETWRT
jgi:hypothetical protein